VGVFYFSSLKYLGMKKLVFILVFLVASIANSQNLTTTNLIEVLNTPSYSVIERYIEPFGFVFKKSENDIIYYERNSRNFSELETLELDLSNNERKVMYSVHGIDKFKNLKSNIIANGFEYLQTFGPLEYYARILPSSTLTVSMGTVNDYTYSFILRKIY
jgi:hypothetical protein